jgi:DNA repair photolyase
MPFRWTINPYRGCEIGCKYCYARYTHEFMGHDEGELFERLIYAKADVATLLRSDLKTKGRGGIAIGTATDPYQPAERRYRATRAILEVFAEQVGYDVSITTKSSLVTRDIDLLQAIGRRNRVSVNMTVTTVDPQLARRLEPKAPRPDLRLGAVRQLADAGVAVGVFANPVMPLITDGRADLAALASAARQAGATYFGGGTLFLMPSAKQQFFPFLDKEFPQIAAHYRTEYQRNAYLQGEFAERIRETVRQVRRKEGLAAGPPKAREVDQARQLALFEDCSAG